MNVSLEIFVTATCNTYVDETKTSSLRSNQTTTPTSSLASEDTFPLILLCTIGTKQPSDLATRDTNITSWYICVRSNVPVQLTHEGDTELPDLVI